MRNSKSSHLLLLTFLVLMFAASVAQAGEISPALQTLLEDTDADKPVSVLVHFQNRVDILDLSAQLSTRKVTRQQRHAEIVYALQDAARVQEDLAQELDAAAADRGILGYTRYWIANVMVVYAVPAEIERIALRGDVDYLEPNFEPELIKPVDVRPVPQGAETDTRGIGLTPGLTAVRAPEVWNILGIDGSGALIASLDTGVDGTHPAFAARWRGLEADPAECWLDVLGNNTTFPVDNHGHGTHTVGTMTGLAPDDTIGIAPGAQWIAANAIDQGSSSGFDNDIIECFQFFTDPDGDPATIADVPDVVQNSWGVNENFEGYFDCDERWWDVIDNCEAAGVVVVWSAGNEGPGAESLRSPADRATTIYNCFSVGSTLTSAPYNISDFSSRGPSGCFVFSPAGGIKPEVSAPGSDIYSAQPGGGYQYMSGTSMAGPHVSGVVALMRSANPDLEVNDLKQILMDTAVDLGTAGEDNTYGWGIIDAYAAVEACMTGFGTLNGQVTNGSFGDLPLADATVEIPSRGAMLATNASGNYQTSLPFGEYEIVVSYPGFETTTISNVIVYEDLETTMDVALTDIAGPVLSNPTGELATPDTVGPYTIGIQAVDPSTVSSVVLHWIQVPLDWNSVVMTPAGNGFTGDIPGHNANTQIAYYFSAEDGLGQTSKLPEASPDEVFSLYVTQTTYATDAEDPGDPDWQLGVTGDAASSGIWVRADPVGTDYNGTVIQPENDHTADPGSICYVTGNASPGEGAGTNDVDGGCTTLQTPVFDLSAVDRAVIKYWAWFGQGGAASDDDFVVEVSNDNGANWVEMHRIDSNTADWTLVSVDLASLLDGGFELTDQIVIRFLACDLNSGGLVEVAIDDFAIETFVANDTSPVPDVANSMNLVVLHQNHPNPFNPSTTISFNLPRAAAVELGVFGIDGRRVATLVNGSLPSGEHQATWGGLDDGGRAVASGAYFYRLQVEGKLQVKRMVLLK